MEVPLYVTFHFINAYEEKDEDGRVTAVIVDCCEHNADPSILDKLRLQNLRSYTGEDVLPDARLVQPFKIRSYFIHYQFNYVNIYHEIKIFQTL